MKHTIDIFGHRFEWGDGIDGLLIDNTIRCFPNGIESNMFEVRKFTAGNLLVIQDGRRNDGWNIDNPKAHPTQWTGYNRRACGPSIPIPWLHTMVTELKISGSVL